MRYERVSFDPIKYEKRNDPPEAFSRVALFYSATPHPNGSAKAVVSLAGSAGSFSLAKERKGTRSRVPEMK